MLTFTENDDDTARRDSLHAIINNLPDPNYATLRALCLHLTRVVDGAHVNRMTSHNLAVIFGPTLMASADASKAIVDAGWQIKVVDTILQNTYQIFDED
jgi:Rho GTPase-activating protein RGD1